jgi:hypothetical protein
MHSNHARTSPTFLTISILFLTSTLVGPALSRAEVVAVHVISREVVPPEPRYGQSEAYEILKGTIDLEVDPDDLANHLIVDLHLAPRNGSGKVEFSTDFELHKPVDATRGNRRLLYFVNNRGNKHGGVFNFETEKNWLYSRGFAYLWCGWNSDVIVSDRKLNIRVPVATENGTPITGRTYSEIYSYADDLVYTLPLTWGGSLPQQPASLDTSTARLTRRQYPWAEPVEVPREHWAFGRFEDGEVVPDPGFLTVTVGFKPGWLYELVYTATNPRIAGLGLAAIRDVVSFFRYEETGDSGFPNPLYDAVDHVYAWGHSQSGRLIYHFVHQDFNGDEKNRLVFDGVIANCPGAGRGLFNSRFAQPTRHGSHLEDNRFPIDTFPFATVEQVDPVTGQHGDALAGARASGFLPKMIFINSSTDYWTRAASLLHTDVTGEHDAEIDPSVRMYLVSSRAHVDSRIAFVGRALLIALDQWVSRGVDPPPSRIPKIADDTLVDLESWRQAFPKIPGVLLPPSYYQPLRLDLGPRWSSQGIADIVPPKTGPRYVALVPQVDADGHEIAGIRLPEVEVPLVTFTGWSMRSPVFSSTLRRNAGAAWPMPLTKDDREAANDPRPSIAERYSSRADYLLRVVESLVELRRDRLLLDEDVAVLLDQAVGISTLLGELRPIEEIAAERGPAAAKAVFDTMNAARAGSWTGTPPRAIARTLNSKGFRLMKSGELSEALTVFELAVTLEPENANAWGSLGECQMNMKNYDDAVSSFTKSLELDPDNSHAAALIERVSSLSVTDRPFY